MAIGMRGDIRQYAVTLMLRFEASILRREWLRELAINAVAAMLLLAVTLAVKKSPPPAANLLSHDADFEEVGDKPL
jgi:hypothetical protein